MNFKALLKAKMAEQAALIDKAVAENRAMTPEEIAKNEALEAEIKNLEASIEAQAKADARAAGLKEPVTDPVYPQPKNKEPVRLFKNFADQLRAVKNAAVNGTVDPRLAQINNALGANEGMGQDGGYAVQTDFATTMMDSAAKAGQILPLVDQYPISGKSNAVKWTDIDETSVASTVFGGVQVYWAAEAHAVTASKPKLVERSLELQKLMGIAYATYELDQDSDFTSQLYTKAFTLAIQRELEDCVINGSGVGKPLGILNGGALISIAKENAQAADTIKWENIVKMYNRALNKDAKLVWLCHPDTGAQFDFLNFPIGTGGVPVYLPAALSGSVPTLKGKPIVETDHCAALGDKGDIVLADLAQYMLITKGGVQSDTSMHVAFLTAENCFRFIFRANGMPKKNAALTIKNSSNQRSSFVTLDARS